MKEKKSGFRLKEESSTTRQEWLANPIPQHGEVKSPKKNFPLGDGLRILSQIGGRASLIGLQVSPLYQIGPDIGLEVHK